MNWKKYILPVVLVVIIAPLYYSTLAHSIFLEDSAEFVTASHTLSIPHPSGYPFYILTTKIISLIPFLPTVVERVNFVSLFWTILAVALLYICLAKLYKPGIAWALSLLFALAPLVWQQATYAEVYSLNTFFFVLLFWLYLRYHDKPTNKRLYLLIFTYGLSLTNHYLPLALAPLIGILLFNRFRLETCNLKLVTFSKLFAYFILGLTPYLYIPIRHEMNPSFSWFDGNLGKLLTYNLAYGYKISAATFHYVFDGLQTIVQSFGWLGLALGLGGALLMLIHKHYLRHLIMAGGLLFGVIMIILLSAGQPYTDFASQFYKTLHVPVLLIAIISIGYFLQQTKFFYPLLFLLFLIPIINLGKTYNANDRSQYVFLENYSRALLDSLPPNAVLFAHHDEIINDPIVFSLAYQSFVNNLRPDITIQSLTPVFRVPADFPLSELNNYGYEKIKLVEKYLTSQAATWPAGQRQSNGFVYQLGQPAAATDYYIPDNLNLPATNDNLFAQSLLAKYYYDQAARLYAENKFKSGQWFLIQAINYDPQEFSDYYYRITRLRDSYLKH